MRAFGYALLSLVGVGFMLGGLFYALYVWPRLPQGQELNYLPMYVIPFALIGGGFVLAYQAMRRM